MLMQNLSSRGEKENELYYYGGGGNMSSGNEMARAGHYLNNNESFY